MDLAARREATEAHNLFYTVTMSDTQLLSVVALLEDLKPRGLVRGQVGTVIEFLAPSVYEVEFSDDEGRTYATAALKAEQLLLLHHQSSHQAA